MLERLAGDPVERAKHAERPVKCKDYPKVLARLRAKGWVEEGEVALTIEGRKHITALQQSHPDGLPEPRRCQTFVGAIATGSAGEVLR